MNIHEFNFNPNDQEDGRIHGMLGYNFTILAKTYILAWKTELPITISNFLFSKKNDLLPFLSAKKGFL